VSRHTVWFRRSGVTKSVGAALVVMVTAGAASLSSTAAATAAAQTGTSQVATQDSGRRRFEHRFHTSLSCLGCHGSGASHRMTVVKAPEGCNACHHDPARQLSCTSCHHEDQLARERNVPVTLTLQVARVAPTRTVSFRHEVHLASGTGLVCQNCHGTPVTMQRNRECTSCHDAHHDGRAECSDCHAPPPAGAHTAAVHLGCAGSACHAVAKAPVPTQGRALCVYCHAAQRDHEPGGACAACHRIPGTPRSGGQGLPGMGVRR